MIHEPRRAPHDNPEAEVLSGDPELARPADPGTRDRATPPSSLQVNNDGTYIGFQVNTFTEERRDPDGEIARRKEFRDPTVRFPGSSDTSLEGATFDGLEAWAIKLRGRRVIAVESPSDVVGLGATYALLDAVCRTGGTPRLLTFEVENRRRDDILLPYLKRLAEIHDSEVAIVVKMTTLSDTGDDGQDWFFESLLADADWARVLAEDFAEAGVSVIVHVPRELHGRFDADSHRFPFLRWQVPFLRPLLRAGLGGHAWERLADEAEKQRRAGAWGSACDEWSFYEAIERYLRRPADLGQAIAEQEALANREHQEGRSSGRRGQAELLLEQASETVRAGIFTAITYRKASTSEFAGLLDVVMSNDTDEVEAVSRSLSKKGKLQERRYTERRHLRELWAESPDTHLRAAGLEIVESDDGRQVVGFRTPGLRSELQTLLQMNHPLYSQARRRRILKAGVLFHRDLSPSLLRDTIRLELQEMREDPAAASGGTWLARFCDQIVEAAGVLHSAQALLEDPDAGPTQVRRFAGQTSYAFARVADVIRQVIADSRLAPCLDRSLDTLMRGHAQAVRRELLLSLTARLFFVPEVRAMHWLRRLMDEASPMVARRAYEIVLQQLNRNGPGALSLLEEVASWIAQTERSPERASPSNLYGVRLFLEYALESALAHPYGEYGNWPSTYPLFRPLADESGDSDATLDLMMRWLWHPHGERLVLRGPQTSETGIWDLRAHVLELWSMILCGRTDQPPAKAVRLRDRLLEAFARHAGHREIHAILERWRATRGQYLQRHAELRRNNDEEAGLLNARRRHSFALERRLSSLLREGHPQEGTA